MKFGQALEALEQGKFVARTGWNGKMMFIYQVKGQNLDLFYLSGQARKAHDLRMKMTQNQPPVMVRVIQPHIDMMAADGSLVIGWLASQTDMQADDWMILSE